VTVLVELKAALMRKKYPMDQDLEAAGCHVIMEMPGLKYTQK